MRHRLLNQHFGSRIDAARGLIQNEDGRVGQKRAGDGQELLLSLREIGGVLVDERVVAVGQRMGCLQSALSLARLTENGTRGPLHRARDQRGLLRTSATITLAASAPERPSSPVPG